MIVWVNLANMILGIKHIRAAYNGHFQRDKDQLIDNGKSWMFKMCMEVLKS